MTRINREMVPKFFAFAFGTKLYKMVHALLLAGNDKAHQHEMNMAHDKLAQLCCPATCLGTGKACPSIGMAFMPLQVHYAGMTAGMTSDAMHA